MPFVQRVVNPVYISRTSRTTTTTATTAGTVSAGATTAIASSSTITTTTATSNTTIGGGLGGFNRSQPVPVTDNELETVTNITLSNALRQLASLVLIANDIFTDLNKELESVGVRSSKIKKRIDLLEKNVIEFDPKLVTVPESDLETFVQIKNHFKSSSYVSTSLFTPETRSNAVKELYDAAAKTPVTDLCEMDRILGHEDYRSSNIFLCTPVLGQIRRKMKTNIDVEIETRLPAAIEDLRRWTSSEAIGDITVTPDCVARVGFMTSLNNTTVNSTMGQQQQPSIILSLTPIDGVDGGIATNNHNNTNIINRTTNDNNNITEDMPLDHRLPSPEEQCQTIALKFPAELVTVDTSGRRFDRMSAARRSMFNVPLSGNVAAGTSKDGNQQQQAIQQQQDETTVKRRARPRKPRGKRRNTLAGTDQKEIEEAANGKTDADATTPGSGNDDKTATTTSSSMKTSSTVVVVPRSKSSDILKKDTTSGGCDPIKPITTRMSHFNSLKQWGKNRLRLINRNSDEKKENKEKVSDIDDVNVYETIGSRSRRKLLEKERKLSHERKPSYSSSEKSLTIVTQPVHSTLPASINPVKLRESSSIRRQRRCGLGHKDEPNSSSGNWSASSESGRTSIGSEITTQPKSSASSNSLNHPHHPNSGPPSSIISRRRFLNTSASSSVTSEGTITPDLQMHDLYDDGETSSAYSCDTEGYYTSFHVDSGLKTLKEEEPVTPLHTSSALSSTNSFNSSGNQTVLSAENEYELFGKGSTSTTTSSAGTVCTTLMAAGSDRSLVVGPAVPERKSSLTKLNRSNSTASNSTLERSYSSSTVGSTLERMGTIKRNGILIQKEVAAIVHQHKEDKKQNRTESPDSGNNTSSSPVDSNANSSPTQGVRSCSEFEYSESSDLEGVDRIERIRFKTTINSSRIPSMCVITPSNSDDENNVTTKETKLDNTKTTTIQETDLDKIDFKNKMLPKKEETKVQIISVNQTTGYATIHTMDKPAQKEVKPTNVKPIIEIKKEVHHLRKATLLPLNTMFGKLRGVLPTLKKSPNKDVVIDDSINDPIYDTTGEYVTIADVRNNNQKKLNHNSGVYYSNDVVKRNLATVLSGNLNEETEYVSLNELPSTIRCESNLLAHSINSPIKQSESINQKIDNSEINVEGETQNHKDEEGLNRKGARVTLDAQGKVVYSSDSLKRRKGAHTTFLPGPCVKDPTETTLPSSPIISGGVTNRKASVPRPVISQKPNPINPDSINIIKKAEKIVSRVPQETITIKRKDKLRLAPVATTIPIPPNNTQQTTPKSAGSTIKSSLLPIVKSTASDTTSTTAITTTNAKTIETPTTGAMKGAYVNLQQDTTPLSSIEQQNQNVLLSQQEQQMMNQRVLQSPVTTHHQQSHPQVDYQHLYHDEEYCMEKNDLSRLPRPMPGYARQQTASPPVVQPSPFQRNNNIYWTLQARKPMNTQYGVVPDRNIVARDDFGVTNCKVEDLYSTPNKPRKREELKTTPVGFSSFFSPISKQNEILIQQQEATNLKMSPIDPRNTCGFQTSTPSKTEDRISSPSRINLVEDLRNKLRIHEPGSRSNGSSPLSSGRSTPRNFLEPQNARGRNSYASDSELPSSQTCSDRLGTPKTSLMDFKKLLLAKAGKAAVPIAQKPSAFEQLMLNKQQQQQQQLQSPSPPPPIKPLPVAVNTSMNILDLSGSPKTFATRRMIRQGNFGTTGSPSKTNFNNAGIKSMSPRSNWRFNNVRSEVMSTAIPEANSEEDNSSPNNTAKRHSPTNLTVSPIAATDILVTDSNLICEEKCDIKRNIFLQSEENNFMKGELIPRTCKESQFATGMSRAQLLQVQRAQFLMGGNNPNININNNNNNNCINNNNIQQNPIISAQFKNGHYTGMHPTANINSTANDANQLITGTGVNHLSQAVTMTTPINNLSAPSLETAL